MLDTWLFISLKWGWWVEIFTFNLNNIYSIMSWDLAADIAYMSHGHFHFGSGDISMWPNLPTFSLLICLCYWKQSLHALVFDVMHTFAPRAVLQRCPNMKINLRTMFIVESRQTPKSYNVKYRVRNPPPATYLVGNVLHVAERFHDKRRRVCQHCRMIGVTTGCGHVVETNWNCVTCDLALCVNNRNCWNNYHEKLNNHKQ